MDHRYFQPRPTNTAAHRRQAIGLSVAILLAGWLALQFLKNGVPPPGGTPPGASRHPPLAKGRE